MSRSEWQSPFVLETLDRSLLPFCSVLELQWINSRTVVLLDSVEKLHVIDRQTQEELETMEISEVQLVYNSSHFKSLATGGNVSQALVSAVLTPAPPSSLGCLFVLKFFCLGVLKWV